MTKPRLLVLASTFPRERGDGTPGFVLDLALEASREFEVLVLAPMLPGAKLNQHLRHGDLQVQVRRYRYSGPFRAALADGAIMDNLKANRLLLLQVPLLLLGLRRAIKRELRDFRPDLIHAHWAIPQGLTVAMLKSAKSPMLLTTHGGDVFALNSGPLKALKRRAIARAQYITTVNHDMANRLKGLGADPARLEVQPMGVDTAWLKAAAGSKLIRRPNSLAFVGRLVEKKGLGVLLEALQIGLDPDAKTKHRLPANVTLRVIGDGPLRVELQRQALALGLPVEFLGQQSQAAVAELLADSEVFVLPSVPAKSGDQDGLPVSLLEAAAAGCMPVASNLPGIDAVVIDGENGLLVNAGNPRQLAKALATALAQPGFRATAVGLMRLTIERYELSTVGASYNRILRQLLSEDRA